MRTYPFLSVAILLLLGATLVQAQQETATITGEIKDASGATIPQAAITITNIETGISSKSVTSEQGMYTVPNLRPGAYTLTVEKTGFTKTVRSGLVLQINQVVRLDFALQAGSVNEVVEISGSTRL